MRCRILFTWCFILFFRATLLSQQKDFATWNYINLNYKIDENWTASLTEHMMRNENATETWLFLHDVSIQHRINKHFTHELHLRLINQKKYDDRFENREMMYYAINGRINWKGWVLSARTRWQGLAYGGQIKDAYKGPYFYHRFRLGIAKSINYHWRAGVTTELFQPLNRPQRAPLDQVRWGGSLTYRINRHVSVDQLFQIQKQFNRSNPFTYYVWGLGCNFTF